MRKTIEILSVGQRVTGTKVGKNGQPFTYDFINVSILYDEPVNPQFRGAKMGEVVPIDYHIYEAHPVSPGDIVDVEMWTQFFKTKVGVIYG